MFKWYDQIIKERVKEAGKTDEEQEGEILPVAPESRKYAALVGKQGVYMIKYDICAGEGHDGGP